MKIIFLDIDGVLNSREYDLRRDWTVNSDIDESRMPYVRRIVEETGAKIVLSSTWRVHWDKDEAKRDGDGEYIASTFFKFGLEIYGKTPDLGITAERGKEVRAWLEGAEDIERFVILDDYRFGWDGLDGYLVKTNPQHGLTEEDVVRAVALLNK